MAFYIDAGKNGSSGEIAYLLKKCILHCPKRWTEIVFLCIGSDRVTGDCLGPYIGHLLTPHETGHIFVYGTLSSPVHALNLEKISSLIKKFHPHALVIAIDASLGQKKHLGYVTIGNGALYPGAGVQKNLPPVGDIHITGIVNTAGLMEHLTLQALYRGRSGRCDCRRNPEDPPCRSRLICIRSTQRTFAFRSAACSCIKSFHNFMQSL